LATFRSVAHKPVELILLRELSSRLPLPVALLDAQASVVYVNPATERLLGLELAVIEGWPYRRVHEVLDYRHADGSPMEYEDRPLAVAFHDRRGHQMTFILHGADGVAHRVEATAIPLDGQGGVLLGAMSIFWEADPAG
jgi:PAS domain-containing protein